MSHHRHGSRSNAEGQSQDSRVNNTGSYKGCYGSASCGESEFYGDSGVSGGGLATERENALLIARFWAKVNKTSSCWLWTASCRWDGYGQFATPRADGKQRNVAAHRFSYELAHGPIPDGLSVLHRCDVPICVNPDHLFLGTQPDNLNDARAKGRLVDGRHLIKVSDVDVAHIRATYRPRKNGKALAARYGITLVHLLRIVRGAVRPPPSPFERVPHVWLPVRGDLHLGKIVPEPLSTNPRNEVARLS